MLHLKPEKIEAQPGGVNRHFDIVHRNDDAENGFAFAQFCFNWVIPILPPER